ncbi:MAG: hypothetical protein EOO07_13145, partial [Chitinophagaceae bacterium]
MGSNYELLISKINEFTRKFYLNKLLRGSIYAAASILGAYLFLFLFIYYSHPNTATKTALFFSFLALSVVAISFWVIKPGLAYFKLGKNLSIEQAARLIGDHFFTVKDKLLNTLQLKALADNSPQNSVLIMAGIDQKISALRPVPFSSAINLSDNRKHIKYILVPLGIILAIGIIAPRILKEGTTSFISYNKEILPKAPFNFVLLNQKLNVTQGDDLTVNLKLTGDEFPQDLYLEDGANTYKLEKESISRFNYTFKNVLNMSAVLHYPAYLNKRSEEISNVGDLLIPEGTKVTWKFSTENSSSLSFLLQNRAYPLTVNDNISTFSSVIKNNTTYRIIPRNAFVSATDSLSHQIAVINDQFPTIEVNESPDSLSSKALYFSGAIADDYGFSSLKFKYSLKEEGKTISEKSLPIAIKTSQLENVFFYLWDLNAIEVKPGQVIVYYFEVADNDGVNGAKISRSPIKTYQAPSQQEIAAKLAEGSDALKKKMESTIKLASSIEKESKKLSQNLLDKKQLTFEDKKQVEQLLDKQKQLEEAVKDIKKQNEKNTFDKEENKAINDELKEKQKQIDNLFNNILDEKTKELLMKLQRLMEMNSKDQTREELSKMQLDNKSLKNELDRILELYKQLEFEQNLQNKIDRLEEMSKQQKELSKQSKDKNTNANDIKNKQDQLNRDFKALQEELEKLDQKNQELDKPNAFKNPEKETKAIEKKQQESKDQLSKNNKEKASEEQQDAAEEMEELAQKMREEQQEGEEQE